MNDSSVAGTQAVARAAALLREIAASHESGAALADLAAKLSLERPTAHRILQRLVMEKLVVQEPKSRHYLLGPLVYELGLAAKPANDMQGVVGDACARIASECGDTVFSIIRSGLDSLCVERYEGSYPVKALLMNPGRRRPMGIGAGSLALLSAMPQENAAKILEENKNRLKQAGEGALQETLSDIKRFAGQGYALRQPVDAPEILSLSVPVLNAYRTPIYAISISALKFRVESRLKVLVDLLLKVKYEIESDNS